MSELTEATEDNLVRARVVLMKRFPFFGELVKFLRPKVSRTMTPTACVDAKGQMYINPDFANKATASDLLFVLCHEAMHIVNASHARMPPKVDVQLWGQASDIAINHIIVNEGHVPLPRADLIEPLFWGCEEWWGKTHEAIYQDLLKRPRVQGKLKTKWCDPESCKCEEMFQDEAEAHKWKTRIVTAAEAAKGQDNSPGSLSDFIAELTKPKKNWIRVLSLAAQGALRRTYSWRRPNRRTTALGLVTPSTMPEPPEVVVYLDTSGSMCDDLLNEGLTEIAGILQVAKATMILGDAEVYFCGPIRREQLSKLPMQRGGTDFNVVFDKIKEQKLKPRLFIGFSDLCGPFPDQQPAYPVIWCRSSGSHAEPPWGQLIDMN